MNANKWQRRRQAGNRLSANQHRAKARKRMDGDAPDYPVARLSGRYANILINLPWMKGNNTTCIAVDFTPRPHRSDQYLVDGEIITLTELCRSEIRKLLPQIRSHIN